MTADVSRFCIDTTALRLDERTDFMAHVPSGLKGHVMLFAALRRELALPEYFGNNWDALDECLRDLSWIEARRVIIVHQDLPELDPRNLAIYLEVLSSAVADWKPGEAHELVVVFPEASREAISQLIRQGGTH